MPDFSDAFKRAIVYLALFVVFFLMLGAIVSIPVDDTDHQPKPYAFSEKG